MTVKKIIGIAGPARSGKDTVGTYLKNYHGFKGVFFAEPLKEGARTMLGLTDAQLYGDEKEKPIEWLGQSPRYILQTLGTDWGRQLINDDIWLLIAKRRIEAYLEDGFNVCITDVRFDNEANMIRDMGGTIWHVERPDVQKVNKHISEAGVRRTGEDYELFNDKLIADLYTQADRALGYA